MLFLYSGFVIGYPRGVWYRGLHTFSLYVGPLICKTILNASICRFHIVGNRFSFIAIYIYIGFIFTLGHLLTPIPTPSYWWIVGFQHILNWISGMRSTFLRVTSPTDKHPYLNHVCRVVKGLVITYFAAAIKGHTCIFNIPVVMVM